MSSIWHFCHWEADVFYAKHPSRQGVRRDGCICRLAPVITNTFSNPLTHCIIRVISNSLTSVSTLMQCRKIPKISPRACIFQRPFLRGLFLEGPIFGGAYLWGEISVSKSVGLALQLEGNLPFLLCFTLYLRAISKYKPPGAYIWRGDLTEGFLRYEFGGLIHGWWRGLFSEFYGIFTCTLTDNGSNNNNNDHNENDPHLYKKNRKKRKLYPTTKPLTVPRIKTLGKKSTKEHAT